MMKLLLVIALACVAAVSARPRTDDVIPGEYVVVLKESVVETDEQQDAFAEKLRKEFNVQVRQRYHVNSLRMFHYSAKYLDPRYIEELPEVKYVVPDMVDRIAQSCAEISNGETWGLDRMDQTGRLPYTNHFNTAATYIHDPAVGAGEGVTAYVIDTGIFYDHPDFGGRASHGYTVDALVGEVDGHGHGTHVAGTIISNSYGVAKAATAVAVKTLNAFGSGAKTDTMEGMQWAWDDWVAKGRPKAVINMSLGGSRHAAQESLLTEICNDGLTSVVAAGNDDSDACTNSPAVVPEAITVGAMDIDDTPASFSNWGTCVQIFGPGVNVRSLGNEGGTADMSGTSMACPNVAGVVARYMSLLPYTPTAASMMASLQEKSTKNILDFSDPNYGNTLNYMAYVDCSAPPNTSPIP